MRDAFIRIYAMKGEGHAYACALCLKGHTYPFGKLAFFGMDEEYQICVC